MALPLACGNAPHLSFVKHEDGWGAPLKLQHNFLQKEWGTVY